MKQIKVYKCTVCGNIILKLEDKTEALSCCDSPMIMLKVNRTDGAVEKHVPYIKEKVKDCKATGTTIYNIQVGNIPHPMETEHYIN
jgi:superoxide reductase